MFVFVLLLGGGGGGCGRRAVTRYDQAKLVDKIKHMWCTIPYRKYCPFLILIVTCLWAENQPCYVQMSPKGNKLVFKKMDSLIMIGLTMLNQKEIIYN